MFVSVTRLRVRSLRFLPSFLWTTLWAQRQARRAEGFAAGRLLVDARNAYWTLTLWESERAMKAYRGTQAHGKAMPRLAEWCDEAAYAHRMQNDDGEQVPSWEDAWELLKSDGKLSRVNHPSPEHESRIFPRPRLTPLIGRDLKPAS